MKDFKSVVRTIGYHGKILWKGFIRMLFGAATAGLLGLAIYGFIMVPSEDGYVAVCDFIGAIASTAVALSCVYVMGAGKKKGAKR